MLIPRFTSDEIRNYPDQTAEKLNRLVDAVNQLLGE